MTKVVEAVYAEGVLKPVEDLELPERQRVRLIVQTIDGAPAMDREAAIRRLREGIASMDFELTGPLPSRDELHDRV
jgi:predicted DNA-binding antitoxin AbrB/MazE fold protein